jgi:two-component system cell cycle response regulator
MNAESDARKQPEVDLSGSTVLIVDDNLQNLELLVAYLDDLPCRVLTAGDGLEAIRIVEKEPVDLILLDVMMPRMSGFEVCQKLKGSPQTRTIPIIMVTALNELGDIERGVESGTDDFLSKPVKKLELVTRVKSLLRVRHLKRELDRTLAYIDRINEAAPEADEDENPA